MKWAVLCVIATLPACGQLFSFGIKAGGIATGALDPAAQNIPEARWYTVGPSIEVRLPFRFAAEMDVLYQRVGDRYRNCAFTSCVFESVHGNLFRFPALLKYRFGRGPLQPFPSVGVAYEWARRSSGNELYWRTGPMVPSEVVDYTVQDFHTSRPAENHVGVVASGGLEWHVGKVRLAPEFRYTRWNSRYWEAYGTRGYFTGSNPNQAEMLLGISF